MSDHDFNLNHIFISKHLSFTSKETFSQHNKTNFLGS